MKYTGYHFFIDDLELPYAPSELKVTIGSNNKTVELISGDEINILKNPKLTEIEFEIELPRGRQYAFANKLESPIKYTDYFEKLMLSKKPAKLVITRQPPNGGIGNTLNGFVSNTWTVSLEGYDLKESAENAYDITVSLKFKEYVSYGTVKATVTNNTSSTNNKSNTTAKKEEKKVPQPKTHKIKSGDTLWGISHKYYGTGTKWKTIYNANKTIIENTASKYGRNSSSEGHWIYPGTVLTIPMSDGSSSSSSSASNKNQSATKSTTQTEKVQIDNTFHTVVINCHNSNNDSAAYFTVVYVDANGKRVEDKFTPKTSSHRYKATVPHGNRVTVSFHTDYTKEIEIISATNNWEGITNFNKYIRAIDKSSVINFKW